MKLKSFACGLALFSFAAVTRAVPSFLPLKNTVTENASAIISYPVERNDSGISVVETVNLLREIAALNQTSVEAEGTDFKWDFDWTKPWLGAGSLRLEVSLDHPRPIFSIMLWGGYIRATAMTKPALEFTVCHEFGHFLAGAPHQVFPNESLHWSSAEGQADWWAASVCLPALYRSRGLTDLEALANIRKAATDFAHFAYVQYEKGSTEANLQKRAPEQPPQTLTTAYPTTQCRLDTIAAAAACTLKPFATTNASAIATALNTHRCTRPRCWYNEPQP